MPTYVYECKSCNATFEAEQSIKDAALEDCIECATGKVRRVIQPVGIAFKGSGFYVNDSKTVATKPTGDAPPIPEAVSAPPAPAAEAAAPAATVSSTPEAKP